MRKLAHQRLPRTPLLKSTHKRGEIHIVTLVADDITRGNSQGDGRNILNGAACGAVDEVVGPFDHAHGFLEAFAGAVVEVGCDVVFGLGVVCC